MEWKDNVRSRSVSLDPEIPNAHDSIIIATQQMSPTAARTIDQ